MRILILGINYAPELTGIGKYTGEMAEWLAINGHEVKIVTTPPYYPSWKINKPYSPILYRKETINNVEVRRCPIYVPSKPSGIKRILHLTSFAISNLPIMISKISWKPDIVLTIEPTLLCAPTALIIAKFSNAKTWLHIQDYEIDAAFDLGILKSKFLRYIVRNAEKWLMNKFDRISTISEKMVEKLSEKNIPKHKRVFFPNWVDTSHIFQLSRPSTYRKTLNIDDDIVVALYSGNMGEKQGLEIIFEAATLLASNKKLAFVMCGQGATYNKFSKNAAEYLNIKWIPLQPFQQLNELLGLADIHLLPQRSEVKDLLTPSKLTGMLASGRPIVATAREGTHVHSVVSKYGKVVDHGDAKAFADAIESLATDNTLSKELGRSARTYAIEHLGSDKILSDFNHNLVSILQTENYPEEKS